MKVGIIGGGITGLTTALALQKVGISCVVFEQAKELKEIGAGIWLQPNAVKVLDWLGIMNEIKKQGIELNKIEITNAKLLPFKKIKNEMVQDEEGNKTIAIHRARLQKFLFNQVSQSTEVIFNSRFVAYKQNNSEIILKFQNGEERVDVLLGADGIHSSVRQSLFPASSLRSSGQVCWRGVSKMNLPAHLKNLGREAWGNLIRFGFSQIYTNEVYWFAVANEKHLNKPQKVDNKKYIADLFQGFSPVIKELVANTDSTAIHQTILQDLKRLPRWYDNHICLIGDAAHAATPNMGQGACQGIEDAYYLCQLFSKSLPLGEVFRLFELKRRKKVDYIVNTSWQFGKMAHNRLGQSLMKFMFKMTPESVLNSQMNKLYAIDRYN